MEKHYDFDPVEVTRAGGNPLTLEEALVAARERYDHVITVTPVKAGGPGTKAPAQITGYWIQTELGTGFQHVIGLDGRALCHCCKAV